MHSIREFTMDPPATGLVYQPLLGALLPLGGWNIRQDWARETGGNRALSEKRSFVKHWLYFVLTQINENS